MLATETGVADAVSCKDEYAPEDTARAGSHRYAVWRESLCLVPVLNLGIVYWRRPGSARDVQNTLNAIGVVAALVLSLVVAAPMSVSYEEMMLADKRFYLNGNDTNWDYYRWWQWGNERAEIGGYSLSGAMAVRFTVAIFVVVTSLLSSLLAYFFLVAADVRSLRELEVWWRFGRWIVGMSMLSLLLGIIYFLSGMYTIFIAKFPDEFVSSDARSIYNTVVRFFYLVIAMACFASFVAGLANRSLMVLRRRGIAPHAPCNDTDKGRDE